jgi:recombination protein RecR
VHRLPKNVQKLIDHFTRLPGIGPKTALRLVLFLLHSPKDYVSDFSANLIDVKENVHFCSNCFNLSEGELCSICEDDTRDASKILVVEDVLDLLAFESMGEYKGSYHVLGGLISPIQGVGPDDLNISKLLSKVKLYTSKQELEVIVATNPNLEGEATAMYLNNEILKIDSNIRITRIARGVPTGADLDYADRVTLLRSLEGRNKI